MRRRVWSLLILAAGAAWVSPGDAPSGVTGYSAAFAAEPAKAEESVLYYQDPDGLPSYSAVPKRTADGRAYRAVHAGEDGSLAPAKPDAAKMAAPDGPRKIRYYRNPMGLPDKSPATCCRTRAPSSSWRPPSTAIR